MLILNLDCDFEIEVAVGPLTGESAANGHGVSWVGCGRDGNVSIRQGFSMGRIVTTPASARQIDFRPGVQMTPLTLQVTFLIAA